MLLEVVVAQWWWHRGGDKGGNSLCKDDRNFSCKSTIVKYTIYGEDCDLGGDKGVGGGGCNVGGGEGGCGVNGGGVGGGDGGSLQKNCYNKLYHRHHYQYHKYN